MAFDRSIAALDTPVSVDVNFHFYHQRFALAEGYPAYLDIGACLAAQPITMVPGIRFAADIFELVKASKP